MIEFNFKLNPKPKKDTEQQFNPLGKQERKEERKKEGSKIGQELPPLPHPPPKGDKGGFLGKTG